MGEIFDVHGDDGIPIEEELDALDKYSHLPWDEIDSLVRDLNEIGQNPGFYLNFTTEMLNQQLDEIENNVNRSIGDFNEEILRMIRESNEEYGNMNLHTKEYAAVEEVLRSHGLAKMNLQYYPDEPLGVPEWNITLDKDVAEAGAEEILNDYEEWTAISDHITHDWMTDRKLIDDYYWRYEMEPHLQKGAKLDEKTLRSIVTYIADSTTIRGRPLRQVQPGIEAWMIDNYDPEGPSLYEKFGFMNLPEKYAYDYETGTWGYNYGNEQNYDDYYYNPETGYDKYEDSYKYDHKSWDEELIDSVEYVADDVGHVIEDLLSSPPSTYSFNFDTDMINAWLDKEGRNYETISRMYTQEYEDLQRAVEDLLREHEENIRTIDNHLEEQIESTSHDIEEWLGDNFSMEPLNLSAKVQGESKDASTGDIMMYAACAIATMCLIFMNLRNIGKRNDAIPQVDVFERLI